MTDLTTDLQSKLGTIALIGVGKMGEAILAGLINKAGIDPKQIIIVEANEEKLVALARTYGVRGVVSGAAGGEVTAVVNGEVAAVAIEQEIAQVDTVILAVKPQIIRDVMDEISGASRLNPNFQPKRVVSIAAGISTSTVQSYFSDAAVIRVMPNVALLAGSGMSAVAGASGTSQDDIMLVCELFSSMGDAVQVPEDLINAATAINGSGPAYFAYFTKLLADAGEAAGLSPQVSLRLARQTLFGTASYLQQTEQSPDELMVAVTSPGGTTEAALKSFETNELAKVVNMAVEAAVRRAEELA